MDCRIKEGCGNCGCIPAILLTLRIDKHRGLDSRERGHFVNELFRSDPGRAIEQMAKRQKFSAFLVSKLQILAFGIGSGWNRGGCSHFWRAGGFLWNGA